MNQYKGDLAKELLELREKIENAPSPSHYLVPCGVMDQLFAMLFEVDRTFKRLQAENMELSLKARSIFVQARYTVSGEMYFRRTADDPRMRDAHFEERIKQQLKERLIDSCEREGLILFFTQENEIRTNTRTFRASMRVHIGEDALLPGERKIDHGTGETK